MDPKEIRRIRLQKCIDEKFDGRQVNFIDHTSENQGEISAMLSGKKSFGEKKARSLEKKLGLDAGWLDQEQHAQATSGTSKGVIDTQMMLEMMRLFCLADDDGRKNMLMFARVNVAADVSISGAANDHL